MAKPLRSEDPNPPSVQFRDFGVLNDGARSKGAAVTSIIINVTLVALMVILGYIVKTNPEVAKEVATLTLPPQPPPQPKPPTPKPPPPPKPLPPTPMPPPKIKLPTPVPPPPDIKPLPVPQPKPVNLPEAPPKRVSPPPAPVKVNLGVASAASVPNHDEHPSPVRLGNATNPLKSLTGPAVSPINLGNAGMPGMNRANTGSGPRATSVNLGSGCPNCTDMHGRDNGVGPVRGVKLGSGTGPMNSRNYAAVTPVQMGTPPPPPPATHTVAALSTATPPKVTYKPTPVYSEDAKEHHIEGDAIVKVIFRANGTMDVIGLVSGLGHNLDQPALDAARGVRFRPALDAEGHPIDFPTNIIVHFILNN